MARHHGVPRRGLPVAAGVQRVPGHRLHHRQLPGGRALPERAPCDTLKQQPPELWLLVREVCRAVSARPDPASEWEGSVFDDALHDQGGAEALHAGEGGQAVVVELLEGGQVGGDDA